MKSSASELGLRSTTRKLDAAGLLNEIIIRAKQKGWIIRSAKSILITVLVL